MLVLNISIFQININIKTCKELIAKNITSARVEHLALTVVAVI